MRSRRSLVPSVLSLVAVASAALMLAGCKRAPTEPERTGATLASEAPASTSSAAVTLGPVADGDPAKNRFSLDDATAGLEGKGALAATIETSKGTLHCSFFADKAPATVANFVGLARGTRPWKQGRLGSWVKKPFYDGLTFHRVIPGFVIRAATRMETAAATRATSSRTRCGRERNTTARASCAWPIEARTPTARSSSSPTGRPRISTAVTRSSASAKRRTSSTRLPPFQLAWSDPPKRSR